MGKAEAQGVGGRVPAETPVDRGARALAREAEQRQRGGGRRGAVEEIGVAAEDSMRLRHQSASRNGGDLANAAIKQSRAHIGHGEPGADEQHAGLRIDRGKAVRPPGIGDQAGMAGGGVADGAGRPGDGMAEAERDAVGRDGFSIRQRDRPARAGADDMNGARAMMAQAHIWRGGERLRQRIGDIGAVMGARDIMIA